MSRARAVVAFVTFIAVGLAAASPSRAALLSELPRVVFATLLAHVVARGTSRFVLGYPSQRGGVHPPRKVRFVVVAATAFVMWCLLSADASALRPRPWLAAELGRLAVLAAAGVALARWVRSSEPSPLYLATGLVISLSAFAAVCWTGSTDALPRAVRVLLRMPQDAAVAWAAWHMAALRGGVRRWDRSVP